MRNATDLAPREVGLGRPLAAYADIGVASADIDLLIGGDELDAERIGGGPELLDMVRKELGLPQAECLAADPRYSLVVPAK